MNVHYEPELAARKPLLDIVQATGPLLEKVLSERIDHAAAAWGFHSDMYGNPILRLTLADWSDQASRDFTPQELQPPKQAYRPFLRLWGDLLQQVSRKLSMEMSVAEQ